MQKVHRRVLREPLQVLLRHRHPFQQTCLIGRRSRGEDLQAGQSLVELQHGQAEDRWQSGFGLDDQRRILERLFIVAEQIPQDCLLQIGHQQDTSILGLFRQRLHCFLVERGPEEAGGVVGTTQEIQDRLPSCSQKTESQIRLDPLHPLLVERDLLRELLQGLPHKKGVARIENGRRSRQMRSRRSPGRFDIRVPRPVTLSAEAP